MEKERELQDFMLSHHHQQDEKYSITYYTVLVFFFTFTEIEVILDKMDVCHLTESLERKYCDIIMRGIYFWNLLDIF